jgi:hypothetical protein
MTAVDLDLTLPIGKNGKPRIADRGNIQDPYPVFKLVCSNPFASLLL